MAYDRSLLLCLLLLSAACKKSGEGRDIPSGGACLQGSDQSTCAAGLYCETTGKEVRDGDNFYFEGSCRAKKGAGSPCRTSLECVSPAGCTPGQGELPGIGPGTCAP